MSLVGQNIEINVNKNILTITVDLKKDFGPSKSGKSRIIATTSGNKDLGGGVIAGINIYTKNI